jgi:hypothetical protein
MAQQKRCAPARDVSVINMIGLLLPIFDWLIIMIGPRGLLLVVSHLFAVPISVLYGWGCKNVNN